MNEPLKQLDVVALLCDKPDLGLRRGWVGTLLLEISPGVWEVEFANSQGHTVATAPLRGGDLLQLQMDPAR
ncbi:MAG TPA: DUF4926 domain-containing protein [Verrucomicrobiae bacterium]|jgi:hypothetical protein|nr:DUF4926 domain-containing protein [Verrucomicrobiae bacterium]